MTDEEAERLIEDTLYDRRHEEKETCFVVNNAGLELLNCTEEVLPLIEDVLRDVVRPTVAEDGSSLRRRFRGLDYVWGAYLVISAKSCPERAIAFLREMPESLLAEAVAAFGMFFRRMDDGGYNFGTPPGNPLVEFVRELTNTESERLRTIATRVLQQLEVR